MSTSNCHFARRFKAEFLDGSRLSIYLPVFLPLPHSFSPRQIPSPRPIHCSACGDCTPPFSFLQASRTLLGISISPINIGTTESAAVKKGSTHEPNPKFRPFPGNAQAAISTSPARSVSYPVIKWWASWTLSQSRSDFGINRIGHIFNRSSAIAMPIQCSSRWFAL